MALSPLARPRMRPAFQLKPPVPLETQLQQLADVTAMRGYYLVRLTDDKTPRHLVRKDKTCTCERGSACPAVEAVAVYLKAGGQRADDLAAEHLIPPVCPVCGGAVKFEPRLCSPVRGAGWVCVAAARQYSGDERGSLSIPGEAHYWSHAWESVRPFMQRGVVL
jgi:hypothetical protein